MTQNDFHKLQCKLQQRIKKGNPQIVQNDIEQIVYNYMMMLKNAKEIVIAELAAIGDPLK